MAIQCNWIANSLLINPKGARRTMIPGWSESPKNFNFAGFLWGVKHEDHNLWGLKEFLLSGTDQKEFLWDNCLIGVLVAGNSYFTRSFFLHSSQIWLSATICNYHICPIPAKLGSIVPSYCFHRLICGYWRFSIVDGKNTLCLKLQRIVALSQLETKGRLHYNYTS